MLVRLSIRHLLLAAGALVVVLVATVLLSTTALPAYSLGRFRFQGPPNLVLDASDPSRPVLARREPDFEVCSMNPIGIRNLLADNRCTHVATASGDALLLRSKTFAPGHGGMDHYIDVYYPSLGEGVAIYYRSFEEDSDASIADRYRAWQAGAWTDRIVKSMRY